MTIKICIVTTYVNAFQQGVYLYLEYYKVFAKNLQKGYTIRVKDTNLLKQKWYTVLERK